MLRRSRSKSREKRAKAAIPRSITIINNSNEQSTKGTTRTKSERENDRRDGKEISKGKTQIEILRENLTNESLRAIERRQELSLLSRNKSSPPINDISKETSVRKQTSKQNNYDNHKLLPENNGSKKSRKSTRSLKSISNRSIISRQSGKSDTTDQDLWENSVSNHSSKSRRSGVSVKSTRSFSVSDRSIDAKVNKNKSYLITPSITTDSEEEKVRLNSNTEKKLDSCHYLREQLMKESMRAIDRKQKQARRQSRMTQESTSVAAEQNNTDFEILMKQSIKQHSTKILPTTTKCYKSNSGSNPTPGDGRSRSKAKRCSSERFSERRRKHSTNTITASSKRSTSVSSSRSKASSFNIQKESLEKSNLESVTGEPNYSTWRNKVSSIFPTRLRSQSRSRSKSRSRSESKTPTKSVKVSNYSPVADKIEPETCLEDSSCVVKPIIDDVDELEWHYAIMRHDWDVVTTKLKRYEHTKFRKNKRTSVANRKPQVDDMCQQQQISPLLYVDSKGRTTLHLSCIEHMPSKLLRRLLFVERNAASIKDIDGRYPLHLAVMNNLHEPILDRVIHAFPKCLGVPDHLGRTPIQYAILSADRRRPKNIDVTWKTPTTKEQAAWQNTMRGAYENVEFILKTMVTRRKSLSVIHEVQTVIQSVELLAPPTIVNLIVILANKILQKYSSISKRLVDLVFQLNYPLSVIHRVLEKASKLIPPLTLLDVTRERLVHHFNEGYIKKPRKGSRRGATSSCFVKELADNYTRGLEDAEVKISPACGEWFDKLRYLIGRSSNQPNNTRNKTLLHTALTNPQSPPSLIEYLCRLNPAARYENNDGALPIHLACIHWYPETYGAENESSCTRVLNLLLAGDFGLVRREYHGRIALHHAILNGKALPCIQTILNLDRETILIPDRDTNLFAFQLAAISEKYNDDEPDTCKESSQNSTRNTRQLGVIYNLLRTNPLVISPLRETIESQIEKTPLTYLFLNWCYDNISRGTNSEWKLNPRRKCLIRHAIEIGRIPGEMKKWWSTFKNLIWEVYDARKQPRWNTGIESPHLLHAALWNSDIIPPIAIELILQLYPPSVYEIQSGTSLYPLHIAAKVPLYIPLPFERNLSMGSVLEMVTLLDGDALRIKTNKDLLPLHMAITSGKRWKDLKRMIDIAPATLSIRDPLTGLFPFQMVACGSAVIPNHRSIYAKMAYSQLKNASPKEYSLLLRSLCKDCELDKMNCVYSFLRAKPSVIGRR